MATRGCWRRLTQASVAVMVATLAVACGGEREADLPERQEAGSPQAPSIDPEHQVIITAYENFLRVRGEALHVNDPDHPDLTTYTGGTALHSVREDIEASNTLGARYDGSMMLVWAEVAPSNPELPLPDDNISEIVRVDACVDMSEFIPVRTEDGSSLLVEDAERGSYLTVAQLAHYSDDDRWVVMTNSIDWEAPC